MDILTAFFAMIGNKIGSCIKTLHFKACFEKIARKKNDRILTVRAYHENSFLNLILRKAGALIIDIK